MSPRAAGTAAAVLVALACAGPPAAETAPRDAAFAEDGALAAPLTDRPGNAEEGARIYADRASGNCVSCHVIASRKGAEFQGNIGPALDGAAARWSTGQLRGIVADAKNTFPGSIMPSFYRTSGYVRPGDGFTDKAGREPLPPLLSGQQIEDVVAYLATLKPPKE